MEVEVDGRTDRVEKAGFVQADQAAVQVEFEVDRGRHEGGRSEGGDHCPHRSLGWEAH
jgi:hypothetical protein